MVRWILALLAAGALLAQGPSPEPPSQSQVELKTQRPAPPPNDAIEAPPPEEDKSLTVDSYSFNPLQSEKDVRVGNYYFKAGKYTNAARRYLDATKWNADNSDAWLRLGKAAEKSKDTQTAKEAYTKYLKLQPDAKDAADIRKKLAKLK
jgi:tetratricopeptide (TPR) repeat protein